MATKIWRGSASKVTQVTTITFSAYTSGETYTITCNGKDVSFTATASTLANVIDGLVAAIAATSEPEFQEFTAENDSGLVLTAITTGYPFTVTASATGAITPTITPTAVATGPEFFDNADNWEGGVVPAAGDDLVFTNSSVSLRYNIVDAATNYGDITIDSTYTGEIGLPADNAAGYREYRSRFLALGDGTSAFAVVIGQGLGRQSSRIYLDANAADVSLAVYQTGTSLDDNYPVILKNPGALSEVDVYSGRVLIDADASGTLAALRQTPLSGTTQANVLASATVACGAVKCSGGNLSIRGGATSLQASGGAQVTFSLAATCPTMTVSDGAIVYWGSTAGITTSLLVQNRGTIDFSSNGDAKAVQACVATYGAGVLDPLGIITWTTGIVLDDTKVSEVNLDIGRGRTLSIS